MGNRIDNKLNNIIVLLCALVVLALYLYDLKNDYYFHFKHKLANADIEKLEKVKEYRPYVVTLKYFNENTKKKEKCLLKLNGDFGRKIKEHKLNSVEIYYTEQGSCDVYIKDYKTPTKGSLTIHIIVALIALLAVLVFVRKSVIPTNSKKS